MGVDDSVYLPNTKINDNDTRIDDDEVGKLRNHFSNEGSIDIDNARSVDSIRTPSASAASEGVECRPADDGNIQKVPYDRSSIQEKLIHIVHGEQDKRKKDKEENGQ